MVRARVRVMVRVGDAVVRNAVGRKVGNHTFRVWRVVILLLLLLVLCAKYFGHARVNASAVLKCYCCVNMLLPLAA